MRKEMLIRMQVKMQKGQAKALKVAATVDGVESVTITGEERNLLLVIGDGVDSNSLTSKLRRKVGPAEIVELRTLDMEPRPPPPPLAADAGDLYAYRYHPPPSPYHHYLTSHGAGTPPPPPPPMMQQQQYDTYYPAGSNSYTVVHHEYPNDPNNCAVM